MKRLLVTVLSLLMIGTSACEKEESSTIRSVENRSNETEIPINKESKIQKTINIESHLYQEDESILVIHDAADQEVFFLNLEEEHSIQIPSIITEAYLSSTSDSLVLESASNTLYYSFTNGVIGIGSVNYAASMDMGLIINNGARGWKLDKDDYYPNIACKCFGWFDSFPTNCTSGGAGATSCSAGAGGKSCSVSCASSTTPCCTTDSDFDF